MLGDRVRPPEQGPERTILAGMLDFARGAVVRKAAGLTDAQARLAPVPPSTLTAGGTTGQYSPGSSQGKPCGSASMRAAWVG
jgi:hypothetical protein